MTLSFEKKNGLWQCLLVPTQCVSPVGKLFLFLSCALKKSTSNTYLLLKYFENTYKQRGKLKTQSVIPSPRDSLITL